MVLSFSIGFFYCLSYLSGTPLGECIVLHVTNNVLSLYVIYILMRQQKSLRTLLMYSFVKTESFHSTGAQRWVLLQGKAHMKTHHIDMNIKI